MKPLTLLFALFITQSLRADKPLHTYQFTHLRTLYGGTVNSFSVPPSGTRVYCASATGVFYSTNQGATWEKTLGDPVDGYPSGSSPLSDLQFIYAKSDSELFIGGYQGFMKSTNGGQTWEKISFWGTSTVVQKDSLRLFGSNYRSLDGGRLWELIDFPPDVTANQLALTPPGNLFAASGWSKLWKSTDDGTSWTKCPNGPDSTGRSIQAVATLGTMIFVGRYPEGILRSMDEGSTWQYFSPAISGVGRLGQIRSLFVNGRKNILYALVDLRGCIRSLDSGATWQQFLRGLPNNAILSYGVDSMGVLYAGCNTGIYRSSDDGEHWERSCSGLTALRIKAMGSDNRGTVYISGDPTGWYQSVDDGFTWRFSQPETGDMDWHWSSFGADSAGMVYASNYRSSDRGQTWQWFHGYPRALTVDTAGVVYSVAGDLSRSTDRGISWEVLVPYDPNSWIRYSTQMTANRLNNHLFLLAGYYGVFRSTSQGQQWENITPAAREYTDILATEGGTILLAVGDDGVYRSSDDGVHYMSTSGLRAGYGHKAEHLLSTKGGTSFVNLNADLYQSTDEGRTWQEVLPQPVHSTINAMTINAHGYIFIGTDSGVYRTVTPLVTDVEPLGEGIPACFGLSQNYPNPFNPLTAIRYQIAEMGLVTLKIYNLLGQEVATLVNTVKPPGEYTAAWNAGNNPSGVYFYKLMAGKYSEVRKMVLAR